MPSEHKLHVQVANPELVTGFLLYVVYELNLCTYQCQAQGGGGPGNPMEFDCDIYPRGGDFDRTSWI